MNRCSQRLLLPLVLCTFTLLPALDSLAQAKRAVITQDIDPGQVISLAGNTRPEAISANDRGMVLPDLPMNHMMLLLRRPSETQEAFEKFLDELHTPGSPVFHHWLNAAQLGQRFGLADSDVNTILGWLQSQSFEINSVNKNGILIDFSGTAAAVNKAFHTEIHRIEFKGNPHIANMTDPTIPAALAPAIVGIVSLNDFMPTPALVRKTASRESGGGISSDFDVNGDFALVPSDLATIYNFSPAFAAGFTGWEHRGAKEDSDVYNYLGDWQTFVNTFGLAGYGATFTQAAIPVRAACRLE